MCRRTPTGLRFMRPAGWPVGTRSPHRPLTPGSVCRRRKIGIRASRRAMLAQWPTFTLGPRFQVWQVQAVMLKGRICLMELPDESRRPAGSPVLNDPSIAPLPEIVTRAPVCNPLACRRPGSRPGGQSAQRQSAASGLFPKCRTRAPAPIPFGPREHRGLRLEDLDTGKEIGVLLPLLRTDTADYVALQNREEHP